MSTFKRVAVALSGGIDSAVSALLLKNKGFEVIGTFVQNWNSFEFSDDVDDANWICERLNIPFQQITFAEKFKEHILLDLIANFNVGWKPNPDIIYNEHIKFGHFHRYCVENLKVDAVATGHYVQSSFGPFLENFNSAKSAKLLCGVDEERDQSHWLSRISQTALQRSMFPIGTMQKSDVRLIAKKNEFDRILKREESIGSCYGGLQNLQNVISQYVSDKPGQFMDIDSGKMIGEHSGIHHWTVGKECLDNYFVADNDGVDLVFVVSRKDHPALLSRCLVLIDECWIEEVPKDLFQNRLLKCKFRYMPGKPILDCHLIDLRENNMILLYADEPMYAASAGEFAVFYRDNECLGSAKISMCGPSDFFLPASDSSTLAKQTSFP